MDIVFFVALLLPTLELVRVAIPLQSPSVLQKRKENKYDNQRMQDHSGV